MSTTLLDGVVKKNRARLIPFMLALYVLAFLDRSNIGFAKETYQIDTGLSNEAYALGAGRFFVVYAFLGVPANLLMRKFGARTWIGTTTLLWGFLSAAMAWADTESKFLIIRTLLGAAEAGFFPGMIYLTSQWFPQRNRASIMGLFYMGAPLALTLGSPLSGALLEMHGFMGHPGWFWMFVIEGLLAVGAGIFTFFWLDDTPQQARFLSAEEKAVLISQLTSEEEKKVTSRLSDALRNGRVWQLAIIYLTIQVAVYGLIFFLPTQVAALLGTKVGFTASVVAAIPWVAALFGTWLIPRYSDRTGDRRNVAALNRHWPFRAGFTGTGDCGALRRGGRFHCGTAGVLDDANATSFRDSSGGGDRLRQPVWCRRRLYCSHSARQSRNGVCQRCGGPAGPRGRRDYWLANHLYAECEPFSFTSRRCASLILSTL